MDKIIYIRGTYSKEVQKIELDVTENLDVNDFKRVCKRLAGIDCSISLILASPIPNSAVGSIVFISMTFSKVLYIL